MCIHRHDRSRSRACRGPWVPGPMAGMGSGRHMTGEYIEVPTCQLMWVPLILRWQLTEVRRPFSSPVGRPVVIFFRNKKKFAAFSDLHMKNRITRRPLFGSKNKKNWSTTGRRRHRRSFLQRSLQKWLQLGSKFGRVWLKKLKRCIHARVLARTHCWYHH